MHLTERERRFISKRNKLTRAWPLAGGAMLLLTIGLAVWLFYFSPLLANPVLVLSRLEEGTIPESTLATMAAILPFAILACLGLLFALILLGFAAFNNERKLLGMLRQALAEESPRRDCEQATD